MRKRSMVFWYGLFGLLTGITFITCNQSPVFHIISLEVEPVDPLISGMPTNMVQVQETLYVASRFSETIYQYKAGWSTLSKQPGGKILDLAATESNLYALSGDPGSARIYKKETSDDSWEAVPNGSEYPNIQSIYGAGELLFAGAMINDREFVILYYEDGNRLTLLKARTKLLQGAAFAGTIYYLATAGDGIYTYTAEDGISDAPVPGSGGNLVGIIAVGDQIVGVTGTGNLLYNTADTAEGFISEAKGVTFTGGLGRWENADATVKLLLLGVQGSSSSTIHGYEEIVLNEDGTLNTDNTGLNIPGANLDRSSINSTDKYNSTLRRYPVIGLFQAKDSTLFAATVKNGLWSYRERKGEYVWNAED